jgi:DNA polymerase III subunit gamma/tau
MEQLSISLRPKLFARVVGQDVAVRLLQQMVAKSYLPRCIVVSGPAGSGKTTLARIWAAIVNCENVANNEPCGECQHCKAIFASESSLVYEVEAATHRKVEDMDDVRQAVSYAVPKGKRRVVIIDEFHAVSDTAQESLLHLLESIHTETTFILTTTESRKILKPIWSRSFPILLGPVGQEDRKALVDQYITDFGLQCEPGVSNLLSYAPHGMRSVWQLLDKLRVEFGADPITYDEAQFTLGIVAGVHLETFASSLHKSLATTFGCATKFQKSGADWGNFIETLFRLAEDFIVMYESGEFRITSGVSEDFLSTGAWSRAECLTFINSYSEIARLEWKTGVARLYALFQTPVPMVATQGSVEQPTGQPSTKPTKTKAEILNSDPVWISIGRQVQKRVVEAS